MTGRVSRNVKGKSHRQNLVFASAYNAIGIPVTAGMLYPAFGLLLSPVVAALALSLSSVSVIGNALRLRAARLWDGTGQPTMRRGRFDPGRSAGYSGWCST
jgi:cation transport ATPase